MITSVGKCNYKTVAINTVLASQDVTINRTTYKSNFEYTRSNVIEFAGDWN